MPVSRWGGWSALPSGPLPDTSYQHPRIHHFQKRTGEWPNLHYFAGKHTIHKIERQTGESNGNAQFTRLKGRVVNRDETETGENGSGESAPARALVKPGVVNPQHTVGKSGHGVAHGRPPRIKHEPSAALGPGYGHGVVQSGACPCSG